MLKFCKKNSFNSLAEVAPMFAIACSTANIFQTAIVEVQNFIK